MLLWTQDEVCRVRFVRNYSPLCVALKLCMSWRRSRHKQNSARRSFFEVSGRARIYTCHTSLGLLAVKLGRKSIIVFRIYNRVVLWLFCFLPRVALLQNDAYSVICLAAKWRLFHDVPLYKVALIPWLALLQNGAYSWFALLQNGAYSITSHATKWLLFHDLPCYKMALIPWFDLPQNGAYSMICLAAKWRLFHDVPLYKVALIPWLALL
jgi:hypothetical protein